VAAVTAQTPSVMETFCGCGITGRSNAVATENKKEMESMGIGQIVAGAFLEISW
jgi:hypothetical protein